MYFCVLFECRPGAKPQRGPHAWCGSPKDISRHINKRFERYEKKIVHALSLRVASIHNTLQQYLMVSKCLQSIKKKLTSTTTLVE